MIDKQNDKTKKNELNTSDAKLVWFCLISNSSLDNQTYILIRLSLNLNGKLIHFDFRYFHMKMVIMHFFRSLLVLKNKIKTKRKKSQSIAPVHTAHCLCPIDWIEILHELCIQWIMPDAMANEQLTMSTARKNYVQRCCHFGHTYTWQSGVGMYVLVYVLWLKLWE